MPSHQMISISVALSESASAQDAVALIAPLGIETESQAQAQAFHAFEAPAGWTTSIVSESRTGQRAALLEPPNSTALGTLRHTFRSSGPGLDPRAFEPEETAVARAALELARGDQSSGTLCQRMCQ